ncbi:MAG: EAL domain-containing protein [Rubrobacteraceae bacterium]
MSSFGDDRPTRDSQTQKDLHASEKRYQRVIEQAPLSIHVFSPDGLSLLANSAWNELWSVQEGEEPEGSNIFEDEQLKAAGLIPYIEESLTSGAPLTPPSLFYDPARTGRGGDPRWLQPFVYPVEDEKGLVREVTLIIEEITERKKLEDRLFHQTHYDDLTGLPNRTLFLDRLSQALSRAERRGEKVAVLVTDLDNFKYVNDSLSHRTGDELLVSVAGRLRGYLSPEDTVARLGGDEFVVVLEEISGLAEATDVAEGMAQELKAPFTLDGREIFVTISTGIVLSAPGEVGGIRAEELLRNADVAMYRAKERGKNRNEAYEAVMQARASERLRLEGDLRRATEREEFVIHYQPKVDLKNGRTTGFEALVRWHHPERGLVPPLEFVPLAEETDLIVPIERWVLAESCRKARALQKWSPGKSHLTMCVNLSAKHLRNPRLVEEVAEALKGARMDPADLVLEITESVMMDDAPATVGTLEELKALGVELAIDDFGTGYSSMSYLKRFPVDYLKIDRSFVSGLGGGAKDDVITSGMVSLAHSLGLTVIAEGVETEKQLVQLREMGCDAAQGYHFAKPLPGEALSEWLAADVGGDTYGGRT